ncbi:MAG: DUF5722 domain-containing protein [Lachnospiraceae bacterium]|nr:DUF5722 domain-containing protein [Lachnospiraceae bacterium]
MKKKVLLSVLLAALLAVCFCKIPSFAFNSTRKMPKDPKAPSTPHLVSLQNNEEGKVDIEYLPSESDCDGYEIEYSTSSNFSSRVHVKTISSEGTDGAKKTAIERLSKDKVFYVRMRAFRIDYKGTRFYGGYSRALIVRIVLGLPDVEPEPNSAEILSAKIVSGNVNVEVFVPERVRSFDDEYYLVKLHPQNDSIQSVLTSVDKDSEFTFLQPISAGSSLLMSRLAVAIKDDESNYMVISSPTFIDNPEAVAPNQNAYPHPLSKKGRQGKYDTSAGDKHYFHNFYLESIIASPGSHDTAFNYNGKTFYFYRPTRLIDYDSDIVRANRDGGTVTMQIMLRWSSNAQNLITPGGRTPGYNYYAMNVEEDSAREQLEAAFMYLAQYWGQPNRHVDNWILGNEVNTFLNTTGRWYWAGNVSRDTFMANYSETFRILYYAVKSNYANGRVFICTDHTWTDRDRDWGTKGFMTAFNTAIKAKNSNIVWNLANHAYTAVLTNSDFWNDGNVRIYSVAHSLNASFVSPYNLEVLTNFVANNFGSETRIILSEVGFSSTGGDNPTLNGGRQSGPDIQALATAWLFYKGQFTSNIDSVIYHTGDEGMPGKNFSLQGKPAWNVYLYMDTPSYNTYTSGYLPIVGASSWESIVPGFNSATLASMPNR